jgi:hypothetical protein
MEPELIVDVPEEGYSRDASMAIIPTADGGLELDFEPSAADPLPVVDDDNLAETVPQNELTRIAERVIEFVEADLESRKDWEETFKRGLEACGVIHKPKGEDDQAFEGSSRVIHPLIMEAAVQFQARAIEELFPASGPVKGDVLGKSTERLERQRERVEAHMNWQIVYQDPGYFWDVDSMLMYLPFGGSAFKKTYPDPVRKMTLSRYVSAEDVIVPAKASSMQDSPRITHRIWMSHNDLLKNQRQGFYLGTDKLNLQAPSSDSQSNERIKDLTDGTTPSQLPEDADHCIYETSLDLDLPGFEDLDEDGQPTGIGLPYIVSVEVESRRVLSIRRNWKSDETRYTKRLWWTHYKYLPGLGFYGWGLLHAIGGLGEAATGLLRAALDAMAFATLQGGFKSKEARLLGKDITIQPGKWIDTELTAEELAKCFYTPPWKEPPETLFRVLGLILEAGRRFSSTTEAMVGEGGANVPVGTTLARIEQGMKVYSGIHKRLHKAAGEEFHLRAELNYEHMDEQADFHYNGEDRFIYREDYSARIDVVPVSDPNIFSQTQRVALGQALLDMQARAPNLYDNYKVHKRVLHWLKVPDIDEVLPDPDDIQSCDPVTEGMRAMTGKPIKAFVEQDHQAHMTVHQGQIQMVTGSPIEQQVVPALIAHIAEHMAQQYMVQMSTAIGAPIPQQTGDKEKDALPADMERELSLMAAIAAQQQAQEGAPGIEQQIAMEALNEQRAKTRKMLAEAERAEREAQNVGAVDPAAQTAEQVAAVRQEMRELLQETTRNAEKEMAAMREDVLRAQMQANNRDAEIRGKADAEKYRAQLEAQAKVRVAEITTQHERKMEALKRQFDDGMKSLQADLKEAIKQAAEANMAAEAARKEAELARKEDLTARNDRQMPSAAPAEIHVHLDKGGEATKVIKIEKTADGMKGTISQPKDDKGAKK